MLDSSVTKLVLIVVRLSVVMSTDDDCAVSPLLIPKTQVPSTSLSLQSNALSTHYSTEIFSWGLFIQRNETKRDQIPCSYEVSLAKRLYRMPLKD